MIGPDETGFVTRYARLHGTAPEYPAVQAAAAAVLVRWTDNGRLVVA